MRSFEIEPGAEGWERGKLAVKRVPSMGRRVGSLPVPRRPADDTRLVDRLKRRERGALEDMLRLHGSKLYGIAIRFMHKEEDAQEVMQETLIAVWRNVDSYQGRSAFTSWLYRVAANAALMALRKRRRHEAAIALQQPEEDSPVGIQRMRDAGCTPAASVERAEMAAQVRAAIDQLPVSMRAIVLLCDVEEFSIEETALMTGLTRAATKSRLHRGRLALRKELLPYLRGDERPEPWLGEN